MITESRPTPSRSAQRAFGVTLIALGGLLATIVWFRPEGLLAAAGVSAAAWAVSVLFNRETTRRRQLPGLLVPSAMAALYIANRAAGSTSIAPALCVAVFAVLGGVAWGHERFATRLDASWKALFLPMAWGVSTMLLVLVYYGIITPAGLLLRLAGHDPMQRKFDRGATTYWIERDEAEDERRYFRQF